jgi:predicted RNA-binding protein YlxR (DUF448 family)
MTKKIYSLCTDISRRAPQRTCAACRQVKAKHELVRLARNNQGEVKIDIRGKMDGRGAYLCPTPECLGKALPGTQIEHVLKCRITPDNRERLIKSGQELLKELSGKNQ